MGTYDFQNDSSFNTFLNSSDAIFHYTSLRKGMEYILDDMVLKPSKLVDTDDPQEYRYWLFGSSGWGLPEDFTKRYSEATSFCDELIRFKSFVSCFSGKRNARTMDRRTGRSIDSSVMGWEKSRMWSQYGDHHSGVSLVFSKKALLKQTKKTTKGKVIGKKIRYRNLHQLDFRATNLDGNKILRDDWKGYCLQHLTANIDSIFFSKNFDYADESEFRLLIMPDDGLQPLIDICTCLRGVLVGDRTHKSYFPSIAEICRTKTIQGRWIQWSKAVPYILRLLAEDE